MIVAGVVQACSPLHPKICAAYSPPSPDPVFSLDLYRISCIDRKLHLTFFFLLLFFLCSPQWYLPSSITSIPLPSLPLSVEWLELRSVLTTILVPQPLTSNPQPKLYRYSPGTKSYSSQTEKQICFHIRKASFSQGFSDDAHLSRSPEISHFGAPIYLSLTSNRPSPYVVLRLFGKQVHRCPKHIVLQDILHLRYTAGIKSAASG